LEKIGIDVTILHERPNKGRTLISKFEEESADISYAVVLMTPDDAGSLKGEKPNDRARQNVVFELGFFIGRLGAASVCALVAPGVERPSDFEAVVYVELDAGKWKTELARELRAAGISFDHSKVF
jgi:predicted nucleotide-binding protein